MDRDNVTAMETDKLVDDDIGNSQVSTRPPESRTPGARVPWAPFGIAASRRASRPSRVRPPCVERESRRQLTRMPPDRLSDNVGPETHEYGSRLGTVDD